MIKQRRSLLMVVGAILMVSASLYAYHLWTRCPIRYDNFDQITNGMHLAEVESLLGCPPADYRRGEIEYTLDALDELRLHIDELEARWQGDQGDLMIFHDHNKLVVGKTWMKGEPEPWMKSAMLWVVDRIRKK